MSANFCSECGYRQDSSNLFCPGCGTKASAADEELVRLPLEHETVSPSSRHAPKQERTSENPLATPEGAPTAQGAASDVLVEKAPQPAGSMIWRMLLLAIGIFFLVRACDQAKSTIGHAIFGDPKILYDGFMSAHARDYIPGQYEADYVDGRVLMTCKVGGKYDGYFGYFRMRTTFVAGIVVPNPEPEKIYAWLVLTGEGHQGGATALNAEALYDDIRASGCEPPTNVE